MNPSLVARIGVAAATIGLLGVIVPVVTVTVGILDALTRVLRRV